MRPIPRSKRSSWNAILKYRENKPELTITVPDVKQKSDEKSKSSKLNKKFNGKVRNYS